MIKYFFTKQFLLFLTVGISAATVNWLSRIFLSNWLSFSMAVIVAYAIGMTAAYLLNSLFVFPNSGKSKHSQIINFILTNLTFYPIVWLVSLKLNNMLIGLGLTRYSEGAAHLFALSLPMLATFLIYKLFVFKEK